jgi:hypothetical protein
LLSPRAANIVVCLGATLTKRFGTIFPFLESWRQLGRLVANSDFARAVLARGSFDEFVFANTSVSNLRIFAETVQQWGVPVSGCRASATSAT